MLSRQVVYYANGDGRRIPVGKMEMRTTRHADGSVSVQQSRIIEAHLGQDGARRTLSSPHSVHGLPFEKMQGMRIAPAGDWTFPIFAASANGKKTPMQIGFARTQRQHKDGADVFVRVENVDITLDSEGKVISSRYASSQPRAQAAAQLKAKTTHAKTTHANMTRAKHASVQSRRNTAVATRHNKKTNKVNDKTKKAVSTRTKAVAKRKTK